MIKNTKILGLLLLSQAGLSMAGAMGPIAHDYRYYGTLIAGAEYVRTGNAAQTISLLPPFSNTYTVNQSYRGSFVSGIGIGIEKSINPSLAFELGATGYFNSKLPANGTVLQFGLPEFDNFAYRYNIDSNRVMATGKLLSTFKAIVHPYVSGELGAAFNHASQYTETPLAYEAVAIAPFADHSSTSFAWSVGAGIDIDLKESCRLGVGYQFSDLGSVALGASTAALNPVQFRQDHLYAQQVRIQFTVLK